MQITPGPIIPDSSANRASSPLPPVARGRSIQHIWDPETQVSHKIAVLVTKSNEDVGIFSFRSPISFSDRIEIYRKTFVPIKDVEGNKVFVKVKDIFTHFQGVKEDGVKKLELVLPNSSVDRLIKLNAKKEKLKAKKEENNLSLTRIEKMIKNRIDRIRFLLKNKVDAKDERIQSTYRFIVALKKIREEKIVKNDLIDFKLKELSESPIEKG